MKLNIRNEYAKLKEVLIAPASEEYLEEQKEIINIFNKYNIQVYTTKKDEEAKYQIFTRDPFIVIEDKILLCNMKEEIRKKELITAQDILQQIDDSQKIYIPQDVALEGGDVIIHNNYIFVGINGNRTDEKAISFLRSIFEEKYQIIPLKMINPNPQIPWIHLDCLFNPLDKDTALIYENGLDKDSLKTIKTIFKNLIKVTSKEQDELATNVISIGNKIVLVQKRHKRIIKKLEENNFKIETINKYETINEIGFIRCLTCPLEREDL